MVKSCFCRCEMYSDVCIEMKILILYSAIGSMATVDSALFSSSAIRVIKMVVLPLYFAKPIFSEICNGAHLYPLHFTADNSAKPAHDDARIVPHDRYTLQLLFK